MPAHNIYIMNEKTKITIITVVYNNVQSIGKAIESVLRQTYDNIEYIIVDGKSTDGTLDKIKSYQDSSLFKNRITKIVSEKDEGMYDALNKGIAMATGEYIGLVHADDQLYDDQVVENIVKKVDETKCDILYGDGVYVDSSNDRRVVRNWQGGRYTKFAMRTCWLPLHPTVYIKRAVYEKYGTYDKQYKIAGDTDLLIRMLYEHNLNVVYLHKFIIRMNMGGMSTSAGTSSGKWDEDRKILKLHGLPSWMLYCKIMRKVPQFITQKGFYTYMTNKILRKIKKK